MYLGIETSSLVSSVALGTRDKLIGEITMQTTLTHSEQLLVHIQHLLTMAEVDKNHIKGIVVSIGPGSFTGLRIGIGTAKALAYGLSVPVIGIMTMESLAYNIQGHRDLIAVYIDGQKDHVYEALYKWDGNYLSPVQEPKFTYIENALERLVNRNESVVFLGDGVILHKDLISSYKQFYFPSPSTIIPRASSLLLAARERIDNENYNDPMTLVPYYMKRSEAEVLWEKRHNKG